VEYEPKRALPKLGGQFADGFHALFADGHVRFIHKIDDATLRAIITRNGGEVVDFDKIK
jgi:prepilin-type processing-associated H-X9-DG protein